MATTPNNGWTTPDDTNLVKNGAADIRTLANAIDADVLVKSLIDAKGDLLAGTAADTIARLGVGANGTYLVADSGETTGLKWAAAPGGYDFAQIGSQVSLSGSSVSITGISNVNALFIVGKDIRGTDGADLRVTINSDTTAANYGQWGQTNGDSRAYDGSIGAWDLSDLVSAVPGSSSNVGNMALMLFGCNGSSIKTGFAISGKSSGNYTATTILGVAYYDTTAVSSIQIVANGGTFSNGTVKVYGA